MKFGLIARILARIMKLRVTSLEGLENIPKTGPVLFVANHVGQQDPVLLFATIMLATNGKMVHAIAKWKILNRPYFRNHFGTIPLYEDRKKSIEISNNILKNGGSVLIFPEGKIMENDTIGKVKTGAARIALNTQVPVIPIGLIRTKPTPKTEFGHTLDIFFGKLQIKIGTPISLTLWYDKEINEQILLKVNKTIMTPIARLTNKTYIGK